MKSAIHARDLTRVFRRKRPARGVWAKCRNFLWPRYGYQRAVDGISFDVTAGERVAFIGPNGAGKSTTIKMLSGILYPTSGKLSVYGYTPWKDRKRLAFEIGTVFGQRSQLWYDLPAIRSFDLLGKIYRIPAERYRTDVARLIERFALEEFIQQPVRELSLGQRMRCELAASFLHRPKLLFLDEPTIGLDVTAKAIVRDLIKEQSQTQNTTLLLTSHDVSDMERVCDRVIIIHRGKILLDQTVSALKQTYQTHKIMRVVTSTETVSLDVPGVRCVETQPYRASFEIDLKIVPVQQVISKLLQTYAVRDVTLEDPPLEEIIKLIYRRV